MNSFKFNFIKYVKFYRQNPYKVDSHKMSLFKVSGPTFGGNLLVRIIFFPEEKFDLNVIKDLEFDKRNSDLKCLWLLCPDLFPGSGVSSL